MTRNTAREIAVHLAYELSFSDLPVEEFLDRQLSAENFSDLADLIEKQDFYMAAADFRSYMEAQERAQKLYLDRDQWNRMCLMNVAAAPEFFVDRTVEEYCNRIWNM